jgi:hypothetical protein
VVTLATKFGGLPELSGISRKRRFEGPRILSANKINSREFLKIHSPGNTND